MKDDFFVKGLMALSGLTQFEYPDSPNINLELQVMDAGVFWEEIEVNGWKLQKNIISSHYRILNPDKIRITYGNEAEIRSYFDKVLKNNLSLDAFTNTNYFSTSITGSAENKFKAKTLVIYDVIFKYEEPIERNIWGQIIYEAHTKYTFQIQFPDSNTEKIEYADILSTDNLTQQELLQRKQCLQNIINKLENDGYYVQVDKLVLFMDNRIDKLILQKRS